MTPMFVTDAQLISNTLLFSVVENARFLSCDRYEREPLSLCGNFSAQSELDVSFFFRFFMPWHGRRERTGPFFLLY